MENFYNDAVVTTISDVDRSIHNGTQFVRLVLQRPQPTTSHGGASASPDSLTANSAYIDGQFTATPTSGINLIRVGFASGQLVETTKITVYSVDPLDTTPGNWEVATSLDGTDAQFSLANFKATGLSIVETAVTLDGQSQFKYAISFTLPAIGGLRYWRVKHVTAGKLSTVTEVEVVEPLTPTLSYFDTDGSFASSFPFEKPDILDACFDVPTDVFYTIRFNSENVGTTTLNLSDDFSPAEAGTASGTNDFNSARWVESSTNSQFLRVSEELSYNVAAGKGQLETTYALGGDFEVEVSVDPQTLTTESMWFALRALDANNKVVASEGVGLETSPTTSGVYFASYISNFVNSTASCELKEARPLWHNTASGTDSFTITYSGGVWLVSGTLTGGLTDATTGVIYDEGVESSTPLEFLVACTASPSTGEKFTFDLITDNVKKEPLGTGTIGVTRSGSYQTTKQVLLATGTHSIATADLNIELFGNTDGVVKIIADDYDVVTGSGVFPDIAVFTIEKVDDEGDVVGTPLIESFDVIGDSSKTYNDFLDGRVQIACSSSGTSGGGHIYVKVDNVLYKYQNNIALASDDGSSADVSTTAQIERDGTHSLCWTYESGVAGGPPFLTYVEYDSGLDIIHLKTLNKNTLLDTTSDKQILLDISGYTATNEFQVFYDQNDFDTLYYVDGSTNLQAFNLDDRISAFMAVNAEDVTLPAGTAQQTYVNADVINAWGEALDGKTVTFAVTAGDGAVSPSSDPTVSGGRATTQFTVGSTVGVSTVTATVTET
jgi:hypothetical protein